MWYASCVAVRPSRKVDQSALLVALQVTTCIPEIDPCRLVVISITRPCVFGVVTPALLSLFGSLYQCRRSTDDHLLETRVEKHTSTLFVFVYITFSSVKTQDFDYLQKIYLPLPVVYRFFFFFHTSTFQVLDNPCGHRCRPFFPSALAFSFYRA